MFQFFHPRPVVDRRPVAEHSVQMRAVSLPTLTALTTRASVDGAAPARQGLPDVPVAPAPRPDGAS